jgi:hypothetical protein
MKPRGQDTTDAIREWSKDELKGGPARAYDLGKFFFTVSTGTAGLVTGVQKLGGSTHLSKSFVTSLILFGGSLFVALNMVRPRLWTLRGDSDLFDEHKKHITRAIYNMWVWFALWFVGAIFGFYAILRSQ